MINDPNTFLARHNQQEPCLRDSIPERVERMTEIRDARHALNTHLPSKVIAGDILEVGPGGGWGMLELQKRYPAATVIGVTPFPEEVELCAEHGLNVEVGDMHALPLEWSDRFDLVHAGHVLEHSAAPLIALREIHRILKAGAHLAVVMPEPTGYTRLTKEHPNRLDTFPGHIFMPDIGTMIGLMRKAGFVFEAYYEQPQPCMGRLEFCHRMWLAHKLRPGEPNLWHFHVIGEPKS